MVGSNTVTDIMNRPIYLDYMATTPLDPQVAEVMSEYLRCDRSFGNPSSTHVYGEEAAVAITQARQQVASLLNTDPQSIIWTSGATESNNLALFGAARFYANKGKHIITSKTEHKSVLDVCQQLEREGFEVTYLPPQPNGRIHVNEIATAIRSDTILISIMHANNEIGVIQDIQAIGKLARSHGIIFHVDGAQSVGKLAVDLATLPVDLFSMSAHKFYGPKGIGALYVCRRPRVRLQAIIYGGGHQQGLRSGTFPTHQIVGMGKACEIAQQNLSEESVHMAALRDRLWAGLESIQGISQNGCPQHRLPHNLNISVKGVDGEALVYAIKDIAVSTTSACNSASMEPSYVLRTLGLPEQLAHSSIRLSVGRFTTEDEVDRVIDILSKQISRLRKIAP